MSQVGHLPRSLRAGGLTPRISSLPHSELITFYHIQRPDTCEMLREHTGDPGDRTEAKPLPQMPADELSRSTTAP